MERQPFETALIGPNVLLREGLGYILRASNFHILVSAGYVDGYFVSSLPPNKPLLLIIEACCDFGSTLRQIESFKRHCAAGRVVVLTRQYCLREIISAFRAGANAYFVNVTTTDIFIKFLELVVLGETILPPVTLTLLEDLLDSSDDHQNGGDQHDDDRTDHEEDAKDAEDGAEKKDKDNGDAASEALPEGATSEALPQVDNNVPQLSAQEATILRGLVMGDSNKAIARKMLIAEATVKVHVKAILRKIQVRNRTQAAIWAIKNRGFIPLKKNGPASGTYP
jgi:two-component system, NarL family, nitrate/nitrite response regulator NarL